MLRNFTILIFVFILATSVNAQKRDEKNAAETAIRANVAQMMNGWNAKNGAEFAKPFSEDADYVIINGLQIKGREVIAKAHQRIFDSVYKNTTLALSVEKIRFLRADVAIVHASGLLKLVESDKTQTRQARMTMVMTKTGSRWEIAAFQNTEIK